MVDLAQNIGLDFVNLRVDCIDITKRLDEIQMENISEQLRCVRDGLEKGKYRSMSIDFADSLVAMMNGWDSQPNIDFISDCRVHYYRPAIDPFGRFATCDLTAEPVFS